ncbi:hypothetical protein K432DRAFT_397961 [Lepidopterella palustris CBS 459.81]|uniref:Uncharacterized protein n=1 Tax=Lepidopterella palustris CBS 459.81 TaxID=1314670 RepID=A0A8E2DZS7_9PEZI|nr:hypothetical protein K432DRAFT_397961 [Lepidopterella palustris CBS 459.81]
MAYRTPNEDVYKLGRFDVWRMIQFPVPTTALNPSSTPRISMTVGEKGTNAIMAYDLNLLQLSSYFNGSQTHICVREYYPKNNYHSFLSKAQSRSGWGLTCDRMTHGNPTTGFGENWKPMYADFNFAHGVFRRNSTYIKDGSLFQVMAFFNRGKPTSIHCSLGGKIRLGLSSNGREWNWGENYAVKKNEHGSKGLSVSCSGKYCLNLELFRNQEPVDFYTDKGPIPSFGDIRYEWKADINRSTWVVYVARYTICLQSSNRDFGKPNKEHVAEALGLGGSIEVESWNPWRMWAQESMLEDVEVDIIARSIEQVLSVAAVPGPCYGDEKQYHLINSLMGGRTMSNGEIWKDYEACLLHIRLLLKALRVLKETQNIKKRDYMDEYCKRINGVLTGAIKFLTEKRLDGEAQALRNLALYYASHYKLYEAIDTAKYRIDNEAHISSDSLASQLYFWFQSRGDIDQNEHLEYLNSIRKSLGKENLPKDDFLGKRIMDSGYRLALLLGELCPEEEIIQECLARVGKRVDERHKTPTTETGILQPWEYLCRNHFLPLDLALARRNDQSAVHSADIIEALSEARECYKFFQQPDFSFLKLLGSVEEYWDLDGSSLVAATFLSLLESNNEGNLKSPATRITDNLGASNDRKSSGTTAGRNHVDTQDQRYLREIVEILKRPNPTSGRTILLEDRLTLIGESYFPPFVTAYLNTPEVYEAGKRREREHSGFRRLVDKLHEHDAFPDQWNETILANNLTTAWGVHNMQAANNNPPMWILDFPSAVEAPFDQRMNPPLPPKTAGKGVDRFSSSLLGIFVNFVHPDALDTLVNYYGSTSNFQGPSEGAKTHITSITLFHFALERETRDGCIREDTEFTPDRSAVNNLAQPQHLLQICASVCITGDERGEFWTCSILGIENSKQLIEQKMRKLEEVLQNFFYDKFSARQLICIVILTEMCPCVCVRYGKILEELKRLMDLKLCTTDLVALQSSRMLYAAILRGNDANALTKASQTILRVNWAIEYLGKFESTLSLCLRTIEKLGCQRRGFWNEKLKKCETEIWKGLQRRLAEIEDYQTQLKDTYSETQCVRDDLISLCDWNFNQTQVALTDATRRDTAASTKLTQVATALAVMTALFLPGTFMGILLTTPMFKWPDPPEGQILVRLPFEIYWAVSGSVTLIFGCGILFWYFILQRTPD